MDTTDVDSLEDLFEHELRAVYATERQLVDALDEMAGRATNEGVSTRFADHRAETEQHVERLERAFEAADLDPGGEPSPVVEAIDEGRRRMEERIEDRNLLNVVYLGVGVRAEREELTAYERLLALAEWLDLGAGVTDPLEANRAGDEAALEGLRTMMRTPDAKALWEEMAS